jgi:hypothetical protein
MIYIYIVVYQCISVHASIQDTSRIQHPQARQHGMKAGWFWAGIEDFPLARPVSSLGPPKPRRTSRAAQAWEAVQRPQAMAAKGV